MPKKILLINPQENKFRETEMYPSGALLLIGSMLKEREYDVSIIHMIADKIDINGLRRKIRDFEPEIAGITMNTFQTKSAREISSAIKATDKNITVVTGGPHPSALKLDIFKDFPDIDIVVYGEGENTFLEIVEGKDLKDIKGICYDGKINEPRPYNENLDYIPLLNLDLIGDVKKFTGVRPVRAKPSMYIMASRGCPFHCTFCNKSIWGSKVRFRKPQLIIREIEWLHKKYGVKEIFFQDDILNLNRVWLKKILNLIIENNLNKSITYKAPFKANRDLIDKDLLLLAKKANFWLIFYGVENGNQQMLDRMKKGITLEEIERAFRLTHEVGLKTIASFMIGNIEETKQTAKESITLAKRIRPSYAGFTIAIPLPGTELREELIKRKHLLEENYDFYSLNTCVIQTDELTKEDIIRLREIANKAVTGRKIIFKQFLNQIFKLSTYYNLLRDPRKALNFVKKIWYALSNKILL